MKERLSAASAVVMVGALCCGYMLVQGAFRLLMRMYPLPMLGTAAVVIAIGVAVHRKHERDAARRIEEWTSAGDWAPVAASSPWPWVPLLRMFGTVIVSRAWTATVDGLAVTVGELNWDDNAFDGAVVGWQGHGVFVVIGLPVPTEPMAMRRPHRTLGDSHRLDRPELHDAYENGEIPPWTARHRSLFTVQAIRGRLTPAALDDQIRRTLLVIRLLDLGPDAALTDTALPGSGPLDVGRPDMDPHQVIPYDGAAVGQEDER